MEKFSKFIAEKNITKDIFDFVGEKGEKVYDTMMKVAKKNKIKIMKPKNQSKGRMGGDHIQISGDEKAVNDLIKKYIGEAINAPILKPKPHKPAHIKMAIKIAQDKSGNMTSAVKSIDKIARGLSNHPKVKAELRKQNESTIGYGKAMVKKQRDQKKAMITKKDKNTLGKLAALMAKQPKRKT